MKVAHMNAEGSRTFLRRYIKVAAWRAPGKTPDEIRQLTKEAFAKGELQAPARPGVDYMLSNASTVPNEKARAQQHNKYTHVFFPKSCTDLSLRLHGSSKCGRGRGGGLVLLGTANFSRSLEARRAAIQLE
jgi:hypothetical protein